MTAKTRRATVLLCSVAVAALATSAFARPVHQHYRNRRPSRLRFNRNWPGPTVTRDIRSREPRRRWPSTATPSFAAAVMAACLWPMPDAGAIERTPPMAALPAFTGFRGAGTSEPTPPAVAAQVRRLHGHGAYAPAIWRRHPQAPMQNGTRVSGPQAGAIR